MAITNSTPRIESLAEDADPYDLQKQTTITPLLYGPKWSLIDGPDDMPRIAPVEE